MAVTLAQSDAILVPCHTDETTPHHSGNGYDTHHPNTDRVDACTIPPTMGWDPRQGTQRKGHPDLQNAPTLMIGVVVLGPAKQPSDRRPRAATHFGYDDPRNQETMTKAKRTLRCTGQLMNRHRGYSATTAGNVAPRHILPQHGQKTMMIAMTGRAPEDGIACKPS